MNLGFLWLDVKVEKNKPISLLTLSPLYPKTNFHTALRYFFRLYFISLQFFFLQKLMIPRVPLIPEVPQVPLALEVPRSADNSFVTPHA